MLPELMCSSEDGMYVVVFVEPFYAFNEAWRSLIPHTNIMD